MGVQYETTRSKIHVAMTLDGQQDDRSTHANTQCRNPETRGGGGLDMLLNSCRSFDLDETYKHIIFSAQNEGRPEKKEKKKNEQNMSRVYSFSHSQT